MNEERIETVSARSRKFTEGLTAVTKKTGSYVNEQKELEDRNSC